jgi:membrane-bound serine protease (ClpP class)
LFEINPSWFQFPPWLNVIIVLSIIAFIGASIYYGIRAHQSQALAGREELVGKPAEVISVLGPKGEVFIQGERWKAILDEGQAQPGEEVTITKVDGLKLWVTKK